MAEHTELTEKLNKEQKTALAADIAKLSDDEYTEAGIPKVRFMPADEASDGRYPSFKAMANSWNKELFKSVWHDVAVSRGGDAEVIVSPAGGTGVTPYCGCAAEDPCLAEGLLSSFAAGVKDGGLTPCVSCDIPDADFDYMHGDMRERVLNELYFTAYDGMPDGTVFTSSYREESDYAGRLKTYIKNNDLNSTMIYSGVPDDKVKDCLCGNAMVIGGSGENLDAAEETVMEKAVQGAVDFAFTVNKKGAPVEETDDDHKELVQRNIAAQSCVLLKNEGGVLPLGYGAEIAVAGGLSKDVNAQALSDLLKATGRYRVTRRKGYMDGGGIDPDLTEEAAKAAHTAKYAVVFLGFNHRAGERSRALKRTKLPAVQLALLDELTAAKTKVIAVVGSDYPADLSFDEKVAAILVCPSTGAYTAEAICNILTGRISPSGRLAQTWYRDADDQFRMLKNQITSGARSVDVFSGYRGYATGGEEQPYPFGFGLSYTKFEYSALKVSRNEIKFKVKNCGQYASGEIIQVYIGKANSAIVSPKMQLKAFLRVYLKSGETTVCTVKCSPKTFEVYNGGDFVTERGRYNIYIGSSSRDIRLTGTISSPGEKFAKDRKRSCFYDTSRSNIFEGGFTFGKVFSRKSIGKGPLILGLALMMAVLLAGLVLATLQIGGYINFSYQDEWAQFGIMCLITFASAAIFFTIVGGITLMISKNIKKAVSSGSGSVDKKYEREPYEQLFADLYGPEEYDDDEDFGYDGYDSEGGKPAAEKKIEAPETEADEVFEEQPQVEDEPQFRGKYAADITYEDLCSWLSAFTESKGMAIGKTGARKVLSAFAASRLVIVGGAIRYTDSFASALSQYFTGDIYSCDLAGCGEGGIFEDSAFTSALTHAEENPDDMVLVTLYGADDGTAAHIIPFIKCAYAKARVKVTEGGNSVYIPANMWFVILPAAEIFSFSDKLLTRVSAVLFTEITRCEERYAGESMKLNFEQFRSMNDRITVYDDDYKYSLDEEHCWKRIDALEKYLNGATGYVLDNRDMLSMERYSAVYLACGGEQNDALDSVTAAKMVLPAMQALKASGQRDDDFVSLIENRFVDYDNIKKIINYLR